MSMIHLPLFHKLSFTTVQRWGHTLLCAIEMLHSMFFLRHRKTHFLFFTQCFNALQLSILYAILLRLQKNPPIGCLANQIIVTIFFNCQDTDILQGASTYKFCQLGKIFPYPWLMPFLFYISCSLYVTSSIPKLYYEAAQYFFTQSLIDKFGKKSSQPKDFKIAWSLKALENMVT